MAYQGVPGSGYHGQAPTYPVYNQSAQQNQVPYQMSSTAPRSNPMLPYQGDYPPNSNFNQNAYHANSFSPAVIFPSSLPAYPAAHHPSQTPTLQQTWHNPNTARARTHSDAGFVQPATKRQRIELSPNNYPGLERTSSQPYQSYPTQMEYQHEPNHAQRRAQQQPVPASNSAARVSHNYAQQQALAPESQYKLFLPLAEEYFEAAYSLGLDVAKRPKAETVNAYQKLIAIGLSCLEAAMKERMPPRLEAKVIIRYAGILYADTLNYMEAEVALSKGITLCERNHLDDLKYYMQYLLAKVMYKNGPKAAFKPLDAHIADAEACKHYSWVYAFRFLRASLSLESGTSSDTHVALQNLLKVSEIASSRNDRSIFLAATLFQGIANFRAGKADSIERVQRAIAGARAYQLDPSNQIPQLLAMMHILDVSCSILKGVPSETVEKMKAMQAEMDPLLANRAWDEFDEKIVIPVHSREGHTSAVTADTRAVLDVSEDGTEQLIFSWCDKRIMSAISYLLGGMCYMHKAGKEDRARKYIREGLRVFSGNPRQAIGSAYELLSKLQWRDKIVCYFHIYFAFWHAARTDWAKLESSLRTLKETIHARAVPTGGPLGLITDYITGVYLQGTGDLGGALQIFESDEFYIRESRSIVTSDDYFRQDLSILAAMNALWIYQEPSRWNPTRNAELLEKLDAHCQANRNADFHTALRLIKATIKTDPPTTQIKVKHHLVEAMNEARKTSNTQFLCITLSVMSHRFFKDIVGVQAEKSSRAAAIQAKGAGNRLWMSVADGVLASCLEIQQKLPEAAESKQSAIALARKALSKEPSES